MDKGFSGKRITREPSDVQWGAYRYTNNPPVTTYSKSDSGSNSKYERTNLESGRHPGKKKKMSDDYNFGSYGGSKKKASSPRYPWLGGKSRKLSW